MKEEISGNMMKTDYYDDVSRDRVTIANDNEHVETFWYQLTLILLVTYIDQSNRSQTRS